MLFVLAPETTCYDKGAERFVHPARRNMPLDGHNNTHPGNENNLRFFFNGPLNEKHFTSMSILKLRIIRIERLFWFSAHRDESPYWDTLHWLLLVRSLNILSILTDFTLASRLLTRLSRKAEVEKWFAKLNIQKLFKFHMPSKQLWYVKYV